MIHGSRSAFVSALPRPALSKRHLPDPQTTVGAATVFSSPAPRSPSFLWLHRVRAQLFAPHVSPFTSPANTAQEARVFLNGSAVEVPYK